MSRQIYLDHNATTPLLPDVLEAMKPFWREDYGNPSSLHQSGQKAAKAVREARKEVASLLGARNESEIVFTSGGTESNNAVFRSALWTEKKKRRIVTTAVEHSSVLKVVKALQEEGAEVVYCPVDEKGNLDRDRLRKVITDNTALVSVMSANNETGVIFPVEEIGKEVREKGALFHVDSVQSVGKLPISLKDSAIDFLSLSAHKFGGPKGIGVLYLREGAPFRPLCFGGSQERGRRAGTENVPGIVGLGRAAKELKKDFEERNRKVGELRDHFERKVFAAVSDVQINGDPTTRLPNTSNLAFGGVDSEALLILLDQEGICASSGSACLSGAPEPSHVLTAMGFSKERARSSVRFSFGSGNTADEVDEVVSVLEALIRQLREIEFEGQHPHSVV